MNISTKGTTFATLALALALVAGCTSTRTQKSAGEALDDVAIVAQVKTKLIADPVTKAHQIDVESFKGIVQLNGFVDSAAERSQAAALAREVSNVQEVRNNLVVRSADRSAGEVVDDAAITAKVKTALLGSDLTKGLQVGIETRDGVVQLSGFVDDAAARDEAVRLARAVSGVRSVRNEIDVK
jgi:hyperosmotically inducible protein